MLDSDVKACREGTTRLTTTRAEATWPGCPKAHALVGAVTRASGMGAGEQRRVCASMRHASLDARSRSIALPICGLASGAAVAAAMPSRDLPELEVLGAAAGLRVNVVADLP